MRSLAPLLLALGCWLAAPGCMFAHDTACVDDGDCKGSRICSSGECVASGSGDGAGATGATGPDDGTGATSGTGTPTPSGPGCTDLRSGTQTATMPEIALCDPSRQSFSVRIGSRGLVESIDGKSCSLDHAGTKCYSAFPDEYSCGGCSFNVRAESINGTTPVGWSVSVAACSTGCTQYCCSSEESEILHSTHYWLDQTAPGGSSTPSTPSTPSNPRDPCAGCGFPFCDGNCAGCC